MNSHCLNCGTQLPDGVGEALCPICGLRGALGGGETDSVPAAARFVGGYELLEQIARGGMGVVYRARQLDLDRIVAVKMILAGHFASDEARTRFRAEAVAAARLRHPNIVALHEVGEHEGQPYFSMDYVEGPTLAEVIRDGTLPARRAATYVEIIAEAIEHAHSQGVLHRDLKPSNVIIDVSDQPRITDFGLAKKTAETDPLTATGEVFGSPGYMSPEQALGTSGKVSAASDVYSLGALLYHLLTGVPPFRGETLQAILLQVLNRDPFAPRQINPNLPVDLETICLKCLEKEPARRYATARALAEDLGRFRRDEPLLARPLGAPGKAWRWSRRHPALALLLGTVLLLLIAVAIISTLAAVRIKDAERKANANLRDSLLAQARAIRLGGRPGQRFDSLLALEQALPLDASPEFRRRVRSEVSSTLALADARFVPQSQLPLPFDATMGVFDPRLDYFARAQQEGLVTIHRAVDGQEIHRFDTRPRRVDHVMALSPDAAFLALRHGKEVGVWEAATGRLCVLTNSYLRQFAFSADSRRVAIASTTGGLAICELPTGTAVAQWSAPVFSGEPPRGSFLSVAFSPDGRSLALGRGTEPIVEVRDVTSGNVLKSLTNSARIYALAWSRDGELLAGGCMDGTVLVWQAATGALVRRFDGHTALVEALAFHPVSDRLASISDDRTIRFWNIALGESEVALPAEGFAAAFSSDGQRFGPAWQPGHIGLVEFTTPREFRSFRPTAKDYGAFEATFSPDNRLIASLSYGGVLLWEASSGRQLARLPVTDPKFVRFHPGGDALMVSSLNGINRWPLERKDANSLAAGPPQLLFSGPDWQDLAFDRQGTRLLATNPARELAILSNSAADGSTITFGPQERAFAAALSPDGRWAATGSSAIKDVCIWDSTTGQCVHRFRDGQNWQVAFSPDGRWLATFRKTCLLWETGSWKPGPALPLPKENTAVAPAAFAPDSRCIAFLLDEREVHLFSLPEPKLLTVFTAPNGARIRRLEFSPDGSILAAACPLGEVQLWDLRQLRSSLARMNLDWDAPPLPVKIAMETNALAVRVLQP